MVIDGRVAFVGGINIVDDNNAPEGMRPRFDYAVRLEGPVLRQVHHAVRHMWEIVSWANLKRRFRQARMAPAGAAAVGAQTAAFLIRDNIRHRHDIRQADAEYVIFCGVHFMAEVADIMTAPNQIAILPDLAAGCSMADMANLAKVERCWRELNEVLNAEEEVTPVTYINSAADLKAFCGEHGGIVCTSSNAGTIAKWAFAQRPKVLFFPDQHLGRWTGHNMGIPMDEMVVWDPDLELGGLTPEQIRKARILLWKGHCSVHQMFRKAQIDAFRAKYPDGLVIAHPECSFEVCAASDYVGSTEHIVRTIKEAPAGTRWLVGTELNLVNRLAKEVLPREQDRAVHGDHHLHVLDHAAHRPAAPGMDAGKPGRRQGGEPDQGARTRSGTGQTGA